MRMPSRADVEVLRSASSGLVLLAKRDLEAFWASLDLSRPEAARDALLEFLPALTETYGEAAATVAADWYDEVRAAAGVRGSFAADMAGPVPVEKVQARTRFAAGHLFTDRPDAMLGFLTTEVVSKYVLQPGRDTIARSAARDGAVWARVPTGAETCAFCLMLASRGFVYESEGSAGSRSKFHGDCDCAVVPDWSDDPRLDGYNPDALYAKYQEARSASAGKSTSSILSELREQQGIN
jgi:hypothetical protein